MIPSHRSLTCAVDKVMWMDNSLGYFVNGTMDISLSPFLTLVLLGSRIGGGHASQHDPIPIPTHSCALYRLWLFPVFIHLAFRCSD